MSKNPSPTAIREGTLPRSLTPGLENLLSAAVATAPSQIDFYLHVPSINEQQMNPHAFTRTETILGQPIRYKDYRLTGFQGVINPTLREVIPKEWKDRNDISCKMMLRNYRGGDDWASQWHFDTNTNTEGGSAPTTFIYLDSIPRGTPISTEGPIGEVLTPEVSFKLKMRAGDLLIKTRDTIKVVRPAKGKHVFFNAASHPHTVVPTDDPTVVRRSIMIIWETKGNNPWWNNNENIGNENYAQEVLENLAYT